MGHTAGGGTTSGDDNTFVGFAAGLTNSTASDNTGIGFQALYSLAGGASNTALGHNALFNVTTANQNIGIGFSAGQSITTGARNIAIGNNAYDASDGESDNIAIGFEAMTTNTAGGVQNVALGVYAMDALTSGDNNVGVGHLALSDLNTGGHNVAMGTQALESVTDGTHNVGIGYRTGDYQTTLTSGAHNILIGSYCHTSATGSARQIVMGDSVVGSGDNTLTFGNGGTDSAIAFGATSISAPSDIRLKRNINDDVAGLSFINDLRPVTYEWKKEKDIPEDMQAHVTDSEKTFNNDFINHGFIAQEVKEVIDNHSEIKDGFKMWVEDEIDGRQRIAEGALVPMLVKSVQELSAQNADLLARIETLEG